MKKVLAGILVVVVLVFAGFAVAQAAIPSADGTIHGCYHNTTGALRIIDGDTSTCPSGYTALNWSQVGPQGLPGLSGVEYNSVSMGVPGGQGNDVNVPCSAGKAVIAGGYNDPSDGSNIIINRSYPQPIGSVFPDRGAWNITAFNHGTTELGITGWSVCANVS